MGILEKLWAFFPKINMGTGIKNYIRGKSDIFGQVIGPDNGLFLWANRISGKNFYYLPVVNTDCKRMNKIFT